MEAKDLRIDNWVEFLGEEMQLMGLTKHNGENETARHYAEFKGLVPIKLMHLKPIPLTEDWLEKFGFELTYESKFRRCFDLDTSIGFLSFNFSKVIQEKDNVSIASLNLKWASLKYVHQLQNLYFALTGKELQTDETKKKVK